MGHRLLVELEYNADLIAQEIKIKAWHSGEWWQQYLVRAERDLSEYVTV